MRGRGACFVTESMSSDACRRSGFLARSDASGLASHCPSSGFRGAVRPGAAAPATRPRRHGAAATPCGQEKLLAPHLASA